MNLTYEMSLENYGDFYLTVRDDLKSNNIFGVVTEVNILDTFLKENMISEEFHRLNLQRCIKVDKMNLNKELFFSMFISSLLISMIYYIFIPQNSYPLFRFIILIYIFIVYYLSFKYFKLILENV
tara:strand:- start:800 stop:1174 length:375 start_codon:yes stop_codon:yes gene_type:complete